MEEWKGSGRTGLIFFNFKLQFEIVILRVILGIDDVFQIPAVSMVGLLSYMTVKSNGGLSSFLNLEMLYGQISGGVSVINFFLYKIIMKLS